MKTNLTNDARAFKTPSTGAATKMAPESPFTANSDDSRAVDIFEKMKRNVAMRLAVDRYNEAFGEQLLAPVADYLIPDFIQLARDKNREDIALDFEIALGEKL